MPDRADPSSPPDDAGARAVAPAVATVRDWVRDGVVYGGNAWPTILEVGTGERMIDRGIISLYRMLGKLGSATPQTRSTPRIEAQ